MLYELKDYKSLTEFEIKDGCMNMVQKWTKYLGSYPTLTLEITVFQHHNTIFGTIDLTDTDIFKIPNVSVGTFFSVKGCNMFLYQELGGKNHFLILPQVSESNKLNWQRFDINSGILGCRRIYKGTNSIILADNKSFLVIFFEFRDIITTFKNTKYTTVIPTITSSHHWMGLNDLPKSFISIEKDPIPILREFLPQHIICSEIAPCYKHGDYYVYDQRVFVSWDLKHVKYMSKETKYYLKCILLCIQRKKLYTLVPKILWTTYILPNVVFHMPVNSASACIIC